MNEIDRDGNLPTPTVCESSGIEDNGRYEADPVHKQSSYQSDRIKSKNCELQERNDRRVKKMGNTRIDEGMKKEEVPFATIYYHDGGEWFTEDVDQHMHLCPKLVRPRKK